jgi:hypothetical protein
MSDCIPRLSRRVCRLEMWNVAVDRLTNWHKEVAHFSCIFHLLQVCVRDDIHWLKRQRVRKHSKYVPCCSVMPLIINDHIRLPFNLLKCMWPRIWYNDVGRTYVTFCWFRDEFDVAKSIQFRVRLAPQFVVNNIASLHKWERGRCRDCASKKVSSLPHSQGC